MLSINAVLIICGIVGAFLLLFVGVVFVLDFRRRQAKKEAAQHAQERERKQALMQLEYEGAMQQVWELSRKLEEQHKREERFNHDNNWPYADKERKETEREFAQFYIEKAKRMLSHGLHRPAKLMLQFCRILGDETMRDEVKETLEEIPDELLEPELPPPHPQLRYVELFPDDSPFDEGNVPQELRHLIPIAKVWAISGNNDAAPDYLWRVRDEELRAFVTSVRPHVHQIQCWLDDRDRWSKEQDLFRTMLYSTIEGWDEKRVIRARLGE